MFVKMEPTWDRMVPGGLYKDSWSTWLRPDLISAHMEPWSVHACPILSPKAHLFRNPGSTLWARALDLGRTKVALPIFLLNFMRGQIGTTSSTNVEKYIYRKWACLVWKLLLDPVGVFCTLPEPPNSHIEQNPMFIEFRYFPYISPISPLKGPIGPGEPPWNLAVPLLLLRIRYSSQVAGTALPTDAHGSQQ